MFLSSYTLVYTLRLLNRYVLFLMKENFLFQLSFLVESRGLLYSSLKCLNVTLLFFLESLGENK